MALSIGVVFLLAMAWSVGEFLPVIFVSIGNQEVLLAVSALTKKLQKNCKHVYFPILIKLHLTKRHY